MLTQVVSAGRVTLQPRTSSLHINGVYGILWNRTLEDALSTPHSSCMIKPSSGHQSKAGFLWSNKLFYCLLSIILFLPLPSSPCPFPFPPVNTSQIRCKDDSVYRSWLCCGNCKPREQLSGAWPMTSKCSGGPRHSRYPSSILCKWLAITGHK